ncbi:VIT1/CCC1 transporter family protein [Kocuria rhizophila]|uniref:VIT1/CCC1 transporter family protein n=1 Tax=Kocuria rhizophila TaxID=72000 RepID=UPI000C878DD8|nr:VIT1/CCC1 family protein [Kocuria rhizophila]MCT1958352.1 VIT1/CCC1 family protein [Kocuria rhizophila]MCT2073896.1 VIT1/CCC1 family protein [Kocuria rhizophila]PMR90523.1 rubrerythrin family protein [Kocuria rhizophila]WSQ05686.1 VIT1/CCC1 family protein [Kocuria rhizophila]
MPEPTSTHSPVPGTAEPTPAQIRRWRHYLADELAEAQTYEHLARHSTGRHAEILHRVAEGEGRHAEHWRRLLGPHAQRTVRPGLEARILMFLAKHVSSVFVLALLQRAESRSPYREDPDATAAMAADEAVHEEIIRALATDGRTRLSGNFRAAVFGANDGLVSNLALVMGVGATGTSSSMVLFSGIAGLLAGALSMGAGEYVSVRSQRELLDASQPTQVTLRVAPSLDLDENELTLIYRARGMSEEAAEHRAAERLGHYDCDCDPSLSFQDEKARRAVDPGQESDDDAAGSGEHEALGTDLGAAASSFCFFASGAVIPILPYIFGLTGGVAMVVAMVLVGMALLVTGGFVGLLSGASPLKRGLRQLGIGYGAAVATYLLGLVFNTGVA